VANQGELPIRLAVVQAGQHERLLIDGARTLMLLGAAAAVSRTTVVVGDAATATHQLVVCFLGLVTWLLGVCLLSLVPVAGRFPQAAAFAGAAIANANAIAIVLGHLAARPPWK